METYSLAVCPHDTVRNSEGWYRLVQYLSGHLNANVHFTLALDFADFHERFAASDLVYANPSDTLKLVDQHGYTPLVRVTGRYDEAVLVAGTEGPQPELANLAGAKLATISEQLPTALALRMLSAQGVAPGELLDRPTWLSVVQAVWSGDAPYGILDHDAYADLSPQGQAMVQLITTTSEQCAFHTFCVGPKLTAQTETLRQLLLAMAGDEQGSDVLADLSISGWTAVSEAEVATMRGVLR
jgi:ABC-type phosphate/phosphonate transport system substrate-binding protein